MATAVSSVRADARGKCFAASTALQMKSLSADLLAISLARRSSSGFGGRGTRYCEEWRLIHIVVPSDSFGILPGDLVSDDTKRVTLGDLLPKEEK